MSTEELKEETSKPEQSRGNNNQNRRRRTDAPNISKTIKNLWRAYREENKKSRTSLKQFARSLNDATAKLWFGNKGGHLDRVAKKTKLETRGATIRAIAQATKSARKKVKTNASKPAPTASYP